MDCHDIKMHFHVVRIDHSVIADRFSWEIKVLNEPVRTTILIQDCYDGKVFILPKLQNVLNDGSIYFVTQTLSTKFFVLCHAPMD